jgi:hypothetical protein
MHELKFVMCFFTVTLKINEIIEKEVRTRIITRPQFKKLYHDYTYFDIE